VIDLVVLGAGIAGLAAGLRALRAGARVAVLDRAREPGGKVRTERAGGYLVEWGPQSFLDEADGPVRALVRDLGLDAEVLAARPEARKRYVLRRGRPRLVPREVRRILGMAGFLRALAEPLVRRGASGAEESVAAFARRRFGARAAARLFDPLVSGIFAGDPERLEVAAALPRLAALERDYGSVIGGVLRGGFRPRPLATFRRGMGTLPEALARALAPALRLGADVRGISRAAGGWRVEGAEPLETRALVVAAPAFAAADLLEPHDAPLAALLREIPYADVAAVALGYDAARAFPRGPGAAGESRGPPAGFGFLAPAEEGRAILGCLFPSSAFEGQAPPGKVLLRALAGGRRAPELAALPDADLLARVRGEVEPLVHARADPEFTRILRHPRGIPQYEIGHAARLAAIEERRRALPGLHLAGNAYRGIAVGDVVADAARVADAALRER
jgi:oxygen-dependent protoporphyrinogen oxidase